MNSETVKTHELTPNNARGVEPVKAVSSLALSLALAGRIKHGDLWRALTERGWTQKQLAGFLSVSQQKIGNWLNLHEAPSQAALERIEGKLFELTGKLPEDLWPEWSRDPEWLDADKRISIHRDVTPKMLADRGVFALPPTPEDIVSRQEQADAIRDALRMLSPRDAQVVVMRFGLDGNGERKLEEVGQHFAVSKERIRQIEVRALRKLRHPSRSWKLAAVNIP